MSKPVALVSAVDPYPMDAGKKVVLAGLLDYLVERVGRPNIHYLMVGGTGRRKFPVQLHCISKPRGLAAIGTALTRAGTGRTSLQESLLFSRESREEIHRTLDRLTPELEIYDTIRMAQYAFEHDVGKQICYLDDLFSERYGSMLSAGQRYADVKIQPLGNFAAHVPLTLQPLADNPISQRLLLRLERQLVCLSEDRTVHRFDTTLLINEHEAQVLRQRCGATLERVQAIPPLIRRPAPVKRDYRGAPEFIFLGQLSLPHNDDGLRSFLRDVWPMVLGRRSDARLRVVGRWPRPSLVHLVSQYADSVTLEGFVPDLSELFSRAAALINPLRFGSGIKLKVIEALGAGVPVISTRIGADGIASGPDEGVLVGDDETDITELMMLSTNTCCNGQLSVAAREHFAVRYSRSAVFDRYDAAFGLAPVRLPARHLNVS